MHTALVVFSVLMALSGVTQALELGVFGRRAVLQQSAAALATIGMEIPGNSPMPLASEAIAIGDDETSLRSVFRKLSKGSGSTNISKEISDVVAWNPPSKPYSELRYSTSTLLSSKDSLVPPSLPKLPSLPGWMEGHWLCSYQFEGVSFCGGRDRTSLTLPGYGLGTCLALPNVGRSPSPFVQRFVAAGTDDVVEDPAYNHPRKLEGFWRESKVNAVAVRANRDAPDLGPLCAVTGEGCAPEENPALHGACATRCRMDFEYAFPRDGTKYQRLDVSMVDAVTTTSSATRKSSGGSHADPSDDDEFVMARSWVQFNQDPNNPERELTGYYREYVSYDRQLEQSAAKPFLQPAGAAPSANSAAPPPGSSNGKLRGRTIVVAFLPTSPDPVAIYAYSTKLYAITADEAALY